jgi:ribonucleoside-diphosphate reductase alpha chain
LKKSQTPVAPAQKAEPVAVEEKPIEPVAPVQQAEPVAVEQAENSVATVQEVLGDMMGDAPACPDCGHITIRNGSCYKCLNCGNSLGCS